ncbi:hypothetical protein [Pontibacter harenae]|uniref:hypothetical protein n=1 Tax=Pontibacter harenae TaxID=2894083 RepID=UPI001E4A0BB1|nr:hypothetical protein [Pontibacter harenae]MCC9165500.1 hypothetical protein [Pontibacter harenae]
MKYLFLVALFLHSPLTFGQNLKPQVAQVKDKSLVKVLSSVESFKTFHADELVVSVVLVSNGSGSVQLAESDEVSYSIILSVSEYGEAQLSKLY